MEALKTCCPLCIQRLEATLKIDFPSDHGLHKALDLKANRIPQFACHMFCVFMNIQQDLPLAHSIAQAAYRRAVNQGSQEVPDWANQTLYDSLFYSYVVSLHPWLDDEILLILNSLLIDKGTLKISTNAPAQLVEQWVITRFRAAMDLLEAEHNQLSNHPEIPTEPFVKFLALGKDLIAGKIKLQVPFGQPMPEDLLPFCSSQCLVRLTAGQPTTE